MSRRSIYPINNDPSFHGFENTSGSSMMTLSAFQLPTDRQSQVGDSVPMNVNEENANSQYGIAYGSTRGNHQDNDSYISLHDEDRHSNFSNNSGLRIENSSIIGLPPISSLQLPTDRQSQRIIAGGTPSIKMTYENNRQENGSCRNSSKSTIKSNASNQRKKLEIELNYLRKKQQQMDQILRVERDLELLRIEEEKDNESNDNAEVLHQKDKLINDNYNRIRNWIDDTKKYHQEQQSHSPEMQTNVENVNQFNITMEENDIQEQHVTFKQNSVKNRNNRNQSIYEAGCVNANQSIHSNSSNQNAITDHLFKRKKMNDINLNNNYQNNNLRNNKNSSMYINNSNRLPTVRENVNLGSWMVRQSIPKDLPIFNGDPEQWPLFITQYRNTTRICNFSIYENQIRLQKCLKGKALEAVQSLLILPGNVEHVIDILFDRFGRPEYIIGLILEKVRGFPVVQENKLDTLVNFYDILTNLIYTLDSYQENDHIRNPTLFKEVLGKLPLSQRVDFLEFYETQQTGFPKLVELHNWLRRKVSAANQLLIPKIISDFESNKIKFKTNKQKKNDMTFAITESKQEIAKKDFCIFCNSELHKIYNCDKFIKLNVDKRWQFATQNKICFSCLSSTHSLKMCRRRRTCSVENCTRPHHPLLHKNVSSTNPLNQSISQPKVETNCHIMEPNKVLLKIIPIVLKGPNSEIQTYALLDDASTVTLIESDIAQELGLEGPTQPLQIKWTNDVFNRQENSQSVSVSIKGVFSNNMYMLRRVKTMQKLSLPEQSIDFNTISSNYSYLKSFSYLAYSNAKPTILIGQDNWPVMSSRKIVSGPWNGPTASKTLLGWVIHGNLYDSTQIHSNQFHVHVHSTNDHNNYDDIDKISKMLKEQWSYDISGTTPLTEFGMSKDDQRCLNILSETIKRKDGRFESGLLWKSNTINLPESRNNAMARLRYLEKKMDKDVTYANSYCTKLTEYIEKGYLRKISKAEEKEFSPCLWYLPHFGVINPNKPKLRIVFDAASKSNGVSLNDNLLTGPDLYNSLIKILMNFRIHKIAFVGDIKEMFLQILMRKEDRFAQRILWRGMDRNREPDVYELQVVFFGASCSPCVAQAVRDRNAEDYKHEFPLVYDEIIKNHYMDDYLGGADSFEDAISLVNNIIKVHSKAGFQMCNWISNSTALMAHIDESLHAKNYDFCSSDDNDERVLGMWWNFDTDTFSFRTKFHKINPNILNLTIIPTKRDILKIIMSIFDPLGFLSNFIIIGKILMQNIWQSGINWDDKITTSQFEIWKTWCKNLQLIKTFNIPRNLCSLPRNLMMTQMHVFCDASENAYSAVVYLRFGYESNIETRLICAKARVAPLKPTSIPRLELQAALLGARLGNTVRNDLNMKIHEHFYWSDSKTVLYWIYSNSRRFKTFVAQRLGEIHELTDPKDWNYVPSKVNIADDATKAKPIDLSSSGIWLNGPLFLKNDRSQWPLQSFEMSSEINIQELEQKSDCVNYISHQELTIFEIPDVNRFSNYLRFHRAVGWFFKYVDKFKKRNLNNTTNSSLNANMLKKAENYIFAKIQSDCYGMELRHLLANKEIPKNNKLGSFNCFLDDDNLIRIKGRLNNSICLKYDTKYPILLDPHHDITKLLIKFYHDHNNHIGTETSISDIRKRFYIPHLRNAVKRAAYECQYCKNLKSKPKVPIMGALPQCRIEPYVRPFEKCGVDCFGPYVVTVNRMHEKRYGVLFTCMSIRAIHLEIAYDLSSSSFIHCLRQFSARRGFPTDLYSDNGSNFRRAAKEINQAMTEWDHDEISQFCSVRCGNWHFNPPLAPHMGGTWERMIQSCKKHLNIILKYRFPKEHVLRTFFCEVENIINNRPLTFNSIDPDDDVALTPNHFLKIENFIEVPIVKTDDRDLLLLNQWRAAQRLADMFWSRWITDYLPNLLVSKKWIQDNKNLIIGDIVLIIDPDCPRNSWVKGKISDVFPGKDGRVRVIDVKTNTGIFRRPITRIIKLDVLRQCDL